MSKPLTVSRTEVDSIVAKAALAIRSILDHYAPQPAHQRFMTLLMEQVGAAYHILHENDVLPSPHWNKQKLGELMRDAIRFVNAPTGYVGGETAVKRILSVYPEWEELTGITLMAFWQQTRGPLPHITVPAPSA